MPRKLKHRDMPYNHPAKLKACERARKNARKDRLLRVFGLSEANYEQILYSQEGVCAICRLPERALSRFTRLPRRLAIDHDHTTGIVRGLLCYNCNSLCGLAHDDVLRLQAAIDYLQRTR